MVERRRVINKLMMSINEHISKIEVKIHRLRLSGNYEWDDLDGIIGKLKMNDQYIPHKRMPNYRTNAFVRFRKRNLTLFLNPMKGGIPKCIIELSYPYQILLSKLRSKLPGLHVWRAEYTIDIFFENPEHVKKYFFLIYSSIYFPYQKDMTLHSHKELDDKTRDKNAWVFTKKMKLYERGPDNKVQREGYWLLNDVDRIRIEFKANYRDLYEYGLNSLKLFSKNPLFTLMLKDRFSFKRVKESVNNLPGAHYDYPVKDVKGHAGAFQNFYLYYKSKKVVKNLSQSIEDVPELLPLYYRILHKIRQREKRWQEKYAEVNKEIIAREKKSEKNGGWKAISIEEDRQEQILCKKYNIR